MHARKYPRPEAVGHLHACMSEARGRRDSPRSEAESSMFCARMTLPRFHKGKTRGQAPHAYSRDGIY
eukprot:359094-Chlamydomonas_euryale.AAC.8